MAKTTKSKKTPAKKTAKKPASKTTTAKSKSRAVKSKPASSSAKTKKPIKSDYAVDIHSDHNNSLYLLGFVSLVIVGLAAFFLFTTTNKSKTQVFSDMLTNALSTRKAAVDVDVISPELSAQFTITGDLTTDQSLFDGTGELTSQSINSDDGVVLDASWRVVDGMQYLKFNDIKASGEFANLVEGLFKSRLNQWQAEPLNLASNQRPFGDISLSLIPLQYLSTDQRDLALEVIEQEEVFEFQESKVTEEEINDRSTYRYPVTVNRDQLKILADIIDDNSAKLDQVFANKQDLKVVVWVDQNSSKLVKVMYLAPFMFNSQFSTANDASVELEFNYSDLPTIESPEV